MPRILDQGACGWGKSSYSGEHADCVETGRFPVGVIAVRDTKHHRTGPVLAFGAPAWTAFLNSLGRP